MHSNIVFIYSHIHKQWQSPSLKSDAQLICTIFVYLEYIKNVLKQITPISRKYWIRTQTHTRAINTVCIAIFSLSIGVFAIVVLI